jgi:hypothetical protein
MKTRIVKNEKCNSCGKVWYDEDVTEIDINGIVTRLCLTCVSELKRKL